MNKKIILILTVVFSLALLLSSCEWEQLEPIEEVPENISFTNDIMPIFDRSCNMGGCHPAGGIPPDLSPENAYLNLMSLQMVDTTNVEESILYVRMIDTRAPMPPEGLLSEYETLLVKTWIAEGAKNN